MTERRLMAAMEEEIAAKIAEIERQTNQTIADIEARADVAIQEAAALERARGDQALAAYSREKRQRWDNEWRIRVRNFQFEVAEHVLEHLRRMAAAVRQRDDYPAVWSRLLAEAVRIYRQERHDAPVLRVARADEALARRYQAEFAAIELDDGVREGVELESADRRLLVKNTLAARLGKGHEQFLQAISTAIRERVKR